MLFSQVIGHQDIKNRLIRSVQEQRIPHAQLFSGPEGIGKLALAVAYAQYICCENRTDVDACGICPSCVKYAKLAHPDLHLVFPIIKPTNKTSTVCDDFVADFRAMFMHHPYFSVQSWFSKIADDAKQGIIYSNESQEIIRKLSLKTYESEFKVMIIWLPEKMNLECANKLLKILEEPPAQTVFLLVSNAPNEILTTILSRTQQLAIPRIKTDDMVVALLRNGALGLTQQNALNIARISNGSYLNAMALLAENEELKKNFERFVQIMRLAWQVGNRKDYESLKTLRKWSEEMAAASVGRERQKKFLEYAQYMTRENFIANLQNADLNYLTTYESDFSQKFSPFINEQNVEKIMLEFEKAERDIERNVNAKMVFFDLVLKIIVLLK